MLLQSLKSWVEGEYFNFLLTIFYSFWKEETKAFLSLRFLMSMWEKAVTIAQDAIVFKMKI